MTEKKKTSKTQRREEKKSLHRAENADKKATHRFSIYTMLCRAASAIARVYDKILFSFFFCVCSFSVAWVFIVLNMKRTGTCAMHCR